MHRGVEIDNFYIGNAVVLAEQWRFAVITFSTYPASLFGGVARFMMFTVYLRPM